MWLPLALGFAEFGAFILAGAALRSLYAGSARAALICARYSVVLGAFALAFCALWLSVVVYWPLEAAGLDPRSAPADLLGEPMKAIIASSALAFFALPCALLVLRAVARRATHAHWSAELARGDEIQR